MTRLLTLHKDVLLPSTLTRTFSLFKVLSFSGLPGGSVCKESACYVGLTPELGRSPGEENDNPVQYSCLANPMDRGA